MQHINLKTRNGRPARKKVVAYLKPPTGLSFPLNYFVSLTKGLEVRMERLGELIIALLGLGWFVAPAFVNVQLARKRGRGEWNWFILGFCFQWLSTIILLNLKPKSLSIEDRIKISQKVLDKDLQ